VHWIAIAPCGFGHWTTHTGRCPGRISSEVRVRGLPRNTLPGWGSAAARPSGQTARFGSTGDPWRHSGFGRRPSHRVRLRLAREPLSFGSAADERGGIGVFCQSIVTSSRFSGALRSFCLGGANVGGSKICLLPSCAYPQAHLSGCTCARRSSSAASFETCSRGVQQKEPGGSPHGGGESLGPPTGAGATWVPVHVGSQGVLAPLSKNRSTRVGEATSGGHLAPRGERLLERERL